MTREGEGWDGKSLKEHIGQAAAAAASAQQESSEALDLSRQNADEIATLTARLDDLEARLAAAGSVLGGGNDE